jgi:hypothetical protein
MLNDVTVRQISRLNRLLMLQLLLLCSNDSLMVNLTLLRAPAQNLMLTPDIQRKVPLILKHDLVVMRDVIGIHENVCIVSIV